MKFWILLVLCLPFFSLRAELPTYKETDNEGMYKPERFSSIEKQLIAVTNAFNSLEAKLNENTKKMKDLEDVLKVMKVDADTKLQSQLGEKPSQNKSQEEEMAKLKADFLAIKNKDIEKIKIDLHDLSQAVKQIQTTSH